MYTFAGERIFWSGGGGRGGALHLAAAGQEGSGPRSAEETSCAHRSLPRQVFHW